MASTCIGATPNSIVDLTAILAPASSCRDAISVRFKAPPPQT